MDRIESDADYEQALKEIARYFDAEPEIGSPAAERFDELAAIITAYEHMHFPMGADVRR